SGAGWAQPLQDAPFIDLEETLVRAMQLDAGVMQGRMTWMSSEAEIDTIRHRDGWTLELGGESRTVDGSRRETRDTSDGRSERDIIDSLDEDGKFMFLGLTNSFLEDRRKRKEDILNEKIKQIDNGTAYFSETENLVLEISEAYLDCYF